MRHLCEQEHPAVGANVTHEPVIRTVRPRQDPPDRRKDARLSEFVVAASSSNPAGISGTRLGRSRLHPLVIGRSLEKPSPGPRPRLARMPSYSASSHTDKLLCDC
jgi:hypothetical protein